MVEVRIAWRPLGSHQSQTGWKKKSKGTGHRSWPREGSYQERSRLAVAIDTDSCLGLGAEFSLDIRAFL